MRERASWPMKDWEVRAILAGAKTQKRFAWPWQPPPGVPVGWVPGKTSAGRYGKPGDRLWVRETLNLDALRGHFYKATGMQIGPMLDYEREPSPQNGLPCRTIPSIHMPRWASRITLEITGVRVERLQDISEADAAAEGVEPYMLTVHPSREALRHVDAFNALWESTHGPGSWGANPWVWVIEFRRVGQEGGAA